MSTYVVMIDQAEVVCIMLEELGGKVRPEGLTPTEALDVVEVRTTDPDLQEHLERAAYRIVEYIIAEVVKHVPGASGGIASGPGTPQ